MVQKGEVLKYAQYRARHGCCNIEQSTERRGAPSESVVNMASVRVPECSVRHFILIAGDEFPIDSFVEMEAAEQAMRHRGVAEALIWRCVGESCNAVETTDKMFAR